VSFAFFIASIRLHVKKITSCWFNFGNHHIYLTSCFCKKILYYLCGKWLLVYYLGWEVFQMQDVSQMEN